VSYHGHGTPNPRNGLTALIVVPGPATDSAVAEITAVMSRLVGSKILGCVSSASDEQPSSSAPAADPAPRPSRRVFSSTYKLAMVAEYENAGAPHREGAVREKDQHRWHLA